MAAHASADMTADEIIRLLDLQPHPEGGHFRETYRDPATDAAGRARSTLIYFLLAAGERSAWHRVDAVEIWHWYAGAPLKLDIAAAGAPIETIRLGADLLAHAWQAAESLGPWTLVGCTVAPGFTFAGFELAPPGWKP